MQTVGGPNLTQVDSCPTLSISQGLNIQLLIVKMEKEIALRKTEEVDLETLFILQLDKEANYLAAFTPKDPTDRVFNFEKWTKLISNPKINMKTVVINDLVIGSVINFEIEGEAEISFWIDRKYWGQGIATAALKVFLETEHLRPLHGRVALDNFRSQKVLEKCGPVRIGNEKGFANARNAEIEEFIYRLT